MKAISKYQQYDFNSIHFNICEQNFQPEDFVEHSGRRKLKRDVVPSVFQAPVLENCIVNATDVRTCNIENCNHEDKDEDEISFFR